MEYPFKHLSVFENEESNLKLHFNEKFMRLSYCRNKNLSV